jgi:hypothetical protein
MDAELKVYPKNVTDERGMFFDWELEGRVVILFHGGDEYVLALGACASRRT